MKVIKKGRKQTGWAKEYTCTGQGNKNGGCGAILLVEEGDLFGTASSSMGEVEHYVTFECSECNVWTDIKDSPKYAHQLPTRSPSRRNEDPR